MFPNILQGGRTCITVGSNLRMFSHSSIKLSIISRFILNFMSLISAHCLVLNNLFKNKVLIVSVGFGCYLLIPGGSALTPSLFPSSYSLSMDTFLTNSPKSPLKSLAIDTKT